MQLGPFSENLSQAYLASKEFMIEIGATLDKYGRVHENHMDYKTRQLILSYPRWLEYYQTFTSKAWDKFEYMREADQVTFPDYNPAASQLITEALNLQQNA